MRLFMIVVCFYVSGVWSAKQTGSQTVPQEQKEIVVNVKGNNIVVDVEEYNKPKKKFKDNDLIGFESTEKNEESKPKTYRIQWANDLKQTEFIVLKVIKKIKNEFNEKIFKNDNVKLEQYETLEKEAQEYAKKNNGELITTGTNKSKIHTIKSLKNTLINYFYQVTKLQTNNQQSAQSKIMVFAGLYDNGDPDSKEKYIKEALEEFLKTNSITQVPQSKK